MPKREERPPAAAFGAGGPALCLCPVPRFHYTCPLNLLLQTHPAKPNTVLSFHRKTAVLQVSERNAGLVAVRGPANPVDSAEWMYELVQMQGGQDPVQGAFMALLNGDTGKAQDWLKNIPQSPVSAPAVRLQEIMGRHLGSVAAYLSCNARMYAALQ